MEMGFEPLSTALGISGTSYLIQLGLINGKWGARLLKGKDIIDSYVFKDEDVEADRPNSNIVVGWILRTITLPNINPYGVMKTVQALLKQAVGNKDKHRMSAPVSETKHVKLEEVSGKDLKRPTSKGVVVEPSKTEKEKRQIFQQRISASRDQELPFSRQTSSTASTARDLPSIPSAGDKETIPFASKVESTAPAKSAEKDSKFCPYCGGNLNWRFCPYCGKPLPKE